MQTNGSMAEGGQAKWIVIVCLAVFSEQVSNGNKKVEIQLLLEQQRTTHYKSHSYLSFA